MTELVRLSKRMAELGLASRREADEWITRGWVRVDGVVVDVLGTKVEVHQNVTIERAAQEQQAAKFTVVLNKPVGYVSGQAEHGYNLAASLVTMDNRWERDRVRLPRRMPNRLVPAGRLDIESVGLLVLTEDGRVARKLIGAETDVEKEYLVRVRQRSPLDERGLALLRSGLELDGRPLRPAAVSWQNDDQLRFVLREGRKRQIRRMCEAVDLDVLGLKRVRVGSVMLGDLPTGQWRLLRSDESF
jgi:23S rRNA pseudouridine2604 synthase